MSKNLSEYIRLRRNMRVLQDYEDYSLYAGEMNPCILDDFAVEIEKRNLSLPLWEPFASNLKCKSKTKNILSRHELRVLCCGLETTDPDIEIVDSTICGPRVGRIDGVIFHPPYFGSMQFTSFREDLSNISDYDEYQGKLVNVVQHIIGATISGALVCAVGRRYRHGGEEIALDLLYLSIFDNGFELIDVWSSLPDIVLIFKRKV